MSVPVPPAVPQANPPSAPDVPSPSNPTVSATGRARPSCDSPDVASATAATAPQDERSDTDGRAGADDDPTVIQTIRGLKDGTVTGKNLSPRARRACVEHLTGEGYSLAEIADILKVSDRTVARDRKAIQESHALEPDPSLAPQFVGKLIAEAERCIARIRRAARDKDADPATRVDAEYRSYQVVSDLIQRLQQLGYLPTAAQRLEASIKHQLDDLPSVEHLLHEATRLHIVAEQTQNGELIHKGEELKQLTAHVKLAHDVTDLKSKLDAPVGPPTESENGGEESCC